MDNAPGGRRRGYCKAKGCLEPPSYSVDGASPAKLCGNHRDEGMRRVQHDDKKCGQEGCGRPAAVSYMSQDGKIFRFCLDHKMPQVVSARTTHCEHPGCFKTPKYGPGDGPMSFCQAHKRMGMFTNRDGQLLVATRDGDAFRPTASAIGTNSSTTAQSRRHLSQSDPKVSEPASPLQQNTGGSNEVEPPTSQAAAATSSSPLTPLRHKQCDVPGCHIQPSYGLTGTSRQRFCTGHKKKGMIGLKNRPCLYPGCNTRPHYGMSGGRPMYCATHKMPGMRHLLKEAVRKRKEEATRKRTATRNAARDKKLLALAAASAVKKTPTGGKGSKPDIDVVDQGKKETKKMKSAQDKKKNPKVQVAGRVGAGKTVKSVGKTGKSAVEVSSPESSSASSRSTSRMTPKNIKQEAPAITTAHSKTKKNKPPSSSSSSSPTVPLPGQEEIPLRSPSSRMADVSNMSPPIELNVVNKVRESVKAEAEASGSCKRARAPSRKALEAAGLVNFADEGAQLMTKERKEEAAKREREFKEKRRQYKAAGLNVGVGIVVVVDACATGGGGHGVTEGRGAEGNSGGWRVVTPAELVRRKEQKNGNGQQGVSDDAAVGAADIVGAAGGCNRKEGDYDETTALAEVENVETDSAAKKSRKQKSTAEDSGCHSDGAKQGSMAMATGGHRNNSTDGNSGSKVKRGRKHTKEGGGTKESPRQLAEQASKRKGGNKPTRVRGGEGPGGRGKKRGRKGAGRSDGESSSNTISGKKTKRFS